MPWAFFIEAVISLVDECDLLVTAVTRATHIAIGLGKKIVLFNAVFDGNEFELYGLGGILDQTLSVHLSILQLVQTIACSIQALIGSGTQLNVCSRPISVLFARLEVQQTVC
jgi:hypothetical protein